MSRLRHALIAAAAVRLAIPILRRCAAGRPQLWDRVNHAGRTVSLLEGPAVVAGCATAVAGAPYAGLAALSAGGLGLLDDLSGSAARKGLRGHLGALLRAEVTTGAIKVIGLTATGAVVAVAVDRGRVGPQTLAAAGVVAGTANLINLFDLRPGRALKVSLLIGLPAAASGSAPAATAVGVCVAALPEDLRGQMMLGDTGAGAVGALLGTALASRLDARDRWLTLMVLTALTLASERVSFSAVIAATPGLRELDQWGRPR